MFSFQVLLLFASCMSWAHCKINVEEYCEVCSDHTMCKYSGFGSACENVGDGGVTEEEKEIILNDHNNYRRLVASGKESRGTPGPQPSAANMLKLTWDDDLAEVAQRWADQCLFEHDKCRKDPRFPVGQNVFWNMRYPVNNVNWTKAIESWYEEVIMFNFRVVSNYQFQSKVGHYTQMVWATTHSIGCGRRDYGYNKIYVCNYGPAGNWLRQEMYQVGRSCKACPEGSTCENHLCVLPLNNGKSNTTSGKVPVQPAKPTKPVKPVKPSKPSKPTNDHNEVIKPHKPNTNTIILRPDQIKDFIAKNLTLYIQEEPQPTISSIESNSVEIDPEIKEEIENIKTQIEKLIVKAISKFNSREQ